MLSARVELSEVNMLVIAYHSQWEFFQCTWKTNTPKYKNSIRIVGKILLTRIDDEFETVDMRFMSKAIYLYGGDIISWNIQFVAHRYTFSAGNKGGAVSAASCSWKRCYSGRRLGIVRINGFAEHKQYRAPLRCILLATIRHKLC